MTVEAAMVFAILAGALVLFVTGWVRADVVALLVLVTLVILGLLPAEEALSGFASEPVIATAGLLILSAGLVRSGVMRWIANRLDALAGGGRGQLVAASTVLPGILSGLVSDIGTISLFIPVVLRLARKNDVSRRQLLLPLAMAALAGGNLTLIGASHNLVVDSLVQEAGLPRFTLFEFTPVGIVLVAAFSLYAFFLGHRLLKGEGAADEAGSQPSASDLIDTYDLQDRLWEVLVREDASLIGREVRDLQVGGEFGLNVLAVITDGKARLVIHGRVHLLVDDLLLLEGRRERVEAFVAAHPGLKLMGHPRSAEPFPASNAELVEVVVPPRSPAVGKTLVDLDTRASYGLTGVAIWRDGRPFRTDVGETPLQPGDGLLLYGSRENTRNFDPGRHFLWLHPPYEEEAPRELRHLGPWAAAVMVLVVVTAALNLVSISVAALAGAVAMVLLGVLPSKNLYAPVGWHTVVLIGAMYPLGLAMEATGAAPLLATFFAGTLGTLGPLAALLGILMVAMLLTQFMHGAAVAIVVTPVALDTAARLQVEPRAFAIAVIIGAAATYLLPVGHPAPLLVRDPGDYEPADYVRYGLGLVVITIVAAAVLLPLLWPF